MVSADLINIILGIFADGSWSQRTYNRYGQIYQCYTLNLEGQLIRETKYPSHLEFSFTEMVQFPKWGPPHIDVSFHDPKEPFSEFEIYKSNSITMSNDTWTNVLLTPRLLEFQNKPSAPCSEEANYSYNQVRFRQ